MKRIHSIPRSLPQPLFKHRCLTGAGALLSGLAVLFSGLTVLHNPGTVIAQAPTPPSPPPPPIIPGFEPPRDYEQPEQPLPPALAGRVEFLHAARIEDIIDVARTMQLQATPLADGNSAVVKLGEFNTLFSIRDNGLKLYAGFSGYNVSLLHINEWNRSKRYSKAYLDANNDPCLEQDIDFEGGVSFTALRAFINTFEISVATFAEFLSDPEEHKIPAPVSPVDAATTPVQPPPIQPPASLRDSRPVQGF